MVLNRQHGAGRIRCGNTNHGPVKPTYKQVVLADTPASLWLMDEVAGTTLADSSGNNYTLSIGSPGQYTFQYSPRPAGLDGAIYFNGAIASASAPVLPGGLTNFSYEFWIQGLNDSNTYLIDRGNKDDIIYGYVANTCEFFGGNILRAGSQLAVPADGNFHHCVYTYDGANLRGYVDGVLKFTTPQVTTLSSGGNITINSSINPYQGGMAAFALYELTLSATQVLNHYNSGMGN